MPNHINQQFTYGVVWEGVIADKFLHALLQKLVGDFFLIFRREFPKFGKFGGNFGGNFAGFFLTHRIKAQKIRGKFRSIFREKIRSSTKNLLCKIHSADVPP